MFSPKSKTGIAAIAAVAAAAGALSLGQRGAGTTSSEDNDTAMAASLAAARDNGSLLSLTSDSKVAFFGADKGQLARVLEESPLVVVDVWASWCGPCKAIKPGVEALQERFSDKGVLVLGLTPQSIAELEQAGWRNHGSSIVLGVGAGTFINHHNVEAYPALLVFRGDEVIGRYQGSDCLPELERDLARFVSGEKSPQNYYRQVFGEMFSDPRLDNLRRTFGGGAIPSSVAKGFEVAVGRLEGTDEKTRIGGAEDLLVLLRAHRDSLPAVIPDLAPKLGIAFRLLSAEQQAELISLVVPSYTECAAGLEVGRGVSVLNPVGTRISLYRFVVEAGRTAKTDEVKGQLRSLSEPLSRCVTNETDSEAGSWAFIAIRRLEETSESAAARAAMPSGSRFLSTRVDPKDLVRTHPNGTHLVALSEAILEDDHRKATVAVLGLLAMREAQSGGKAVSESSEEILKERRFLLACINDERFSATLLESGIPNGSDAGALLANYLAGTLSNPNGLGGDFFYRIQAYAAIVRLGARFLTDERRESLVDLTRSDMTSLNLDLARRANHLHREIVRTANQDTSSAKQVGGK